MTTLVCVAKSVMQYQCPFYSSQGVRIRTCAKGTNSPSAEPRRDGGTTRGRCGTMETASCLFLCLDASLPAVVCVCLSLLLCQLWGSRCLLQSWMLPVVSLHCGFVSLEPSSFFSRLLVLCILPYHCRLCESQSPLCNTSAASVRRMVYASNRAPRAPTAHRRRRVGMAAKRAGAARRWKNKTKCTASSCQ